MMRRSSPAKTSRVNRAPAPVAASAASSYGRDLERWPRSWMGVETDLPAGEALMVCLRPFLEHLAVSGLSPKTIRRHVDNLWLLGGEIIRDLYEDPPRRKRAAERLLRDAVDKEVGPLLYNGSEQGQPSFDATCRKLHRFLQQRQA